MNYKTYGQIRAKVELDLDLQNETNITADEQVGYCNEAIQEAVAEIHKIHEDYFLNTATLALVSGTAAYTLPADIYANKIRDVVYANGAIIYKVRRIRGAQKFVDVLMTNQFGLADDYRYYTQNTSAAAGNQLVLVPASRETGNFITLWYLREANLVPLVSAGTQVASDASIIDIPEFYTFIIQFMKVRCLEKDGADPRLQQAVMILEHERQMMVDTLTQMIPDDQDEVVADFSHYYEHE